MNEHTIMACLLSVVVGWYLRELVYIIKEPNDSKKKKEAAGGKGV